jgi:hypothetical protein
VSHGYAVGNLNINMLMFSAVLQKAPDLDATFVEIPFAVEEIFGVAYRGLLTRMDKTVPHLRIGLLE